ncbi:MULTISPECIES: S9 family peptidase [Asticcacaulis]|uniref:S9 family peptidase n=1 Tax=Asticcacaulis TaxID=76890 RepID=UPI001AEB285D|nr:MULTISPECIES: S9 family peptidase [Asticcacaulis]MBP2158746.1 dipeptidyl aminopeptidase/acylaminoacyl peptidase [Asticcacaulis solisilvae]MDR6799792.1 dipeptidyl aminopeptidase/acylaminoacyl peptidase [Asticcacaulis sp. BE141]
MTRTVIAAALGMMALAHAAWATPTPQDYDRAIGLRAAWSGLTRDIAEPGQWVPDTHLYIYRKTVEGGFQFILLDADTQTKRLAFDHDKLAAAYNLATGAKTTGLALPFTAPFTTAVFSDGGRAVTIRANETEWLCSLVAYTCAKPAGTPKQDRGFSGVVRDLKSPADNTPHPSPDGKWLAFVENHNIAVRPAAGGATIRLSTDGSEGLFYDPESIVWSPDSSRIAAYRVQPGYARQVVRVISSPADQVQPKVDTQLYVKPGDAVDIDRPVLFDVATKKQTHIPYDLFPNPMRVTDLQWRKDGKALRFEYDQRGHQLYRLIEVDAATGKPRVVAEDTSKTFINAYSRRFANDVGGEGKEVIWMSERDGWNHLYLYDATTGKVKNQITRGEFVVRSVLKVDDKARQIWFAANGMRRNEDPYFQHVYRIDFDGRNLTPVTTAPAFHDVAFSSDMSFYVDTYSRVDMPNVAELRRTKDLGLVTQLEHSDISRLTAAGFRPPEVFTAKGRDGKTDIWGVIVRPQNFDPNKTYPVIENIYAGPHSSFVPKTFWPFGPHSSGDKVIGMQSLADMGFIVVQIDGMGTLNRSKAFHDVAWKNLQDAGFPDRIAWHKAAAAKYPSYDISRVGIYGGSAGGQNTLSALEEFPDFYKAGVAYAGCFDNRMDKIGWNEAWMGWPIDESYSRASGVDNAHKLTGHVLLVVGELDMNVDPASTLQVVNALIKARKDFDLIVAPNDGHGALRTTGDITYGLRRQYDFFVRHLQGEATPDWNAASK